MILLLQQMRLNMSRSRKKNPVVCDKTNKWAKKDANKKIRNTEDVGNGNNYKKHYCSWNICDYKFWISKFDEFWNYKKVLRK